MTRAFAGLRSVFVLCFGVAVAAIGLQNGAVLAVLAAFLAVRVCQRWRFPRFTLTLLVGGFVLRLVLVLWLSPPIESDFALLYDAARAVAAGDTSFQNSAYFTVWAYQSGFVAFEAFFLRIWNDPLCLKLVNCLLSAGTVTLLYRIARDRVRPAAARAMAALATLFPFLMLLPTVLTNQISSGFFLVLGVWLLVGRDCGRLRFWRYPLAGLALQIGNILRPEGMVLLVAVLAWAVFAVLERPERSRRLLCGVLALLVVYFAAHTAADAAIRASGLNANGLSNGNPLWKFVAGLNAETGGQYAQADVDALSRTMPNGHVTEQTLALEKQLIAERLNAPPAVLLALAGDKVENLWAKDALNWVIGPFVTRPDIKWHAHDLAAPLRQADRAVFYLALALAAYGLFGARRRADELMPYFVVFAAFCALLLIEIQPRYAYLPQLFLFAAAAFGLDRLLPADQEEKGCKP